MSNPSHLKLHLESPKIFKILATNKKSLKKRGFGRIGVIDLKEIHDKKHIVKLHKNNHLALVDTKGMQCKMGHISILDTFDSNANIAYDGAND
jgi:hypothetical protein